MIRQEACNFCYGIIIHENIENLSSICNGFYALRWLYERLMPNDTWPAPGPRRLVVIHNPAAGQRRRRRLQGVLVCLRDAGCAIDLHPTTQPGDAEAFARTLSRAACDVLVVAGGDGTVNEVVNGLVAAPGPVPPLAVVPLGTANVLAHEIGLPLRPQAIAATITHGVARPIRLGCVNGRHFVLMAGAGLDAQVVAHVSLALKRRAGKAAYVLETLLQLACYRFPPLQVTVDGARYTAGTVVACNGRHYGGPFVAAPAASLLEGRLDICLLANRGPWHALRYGAALVLGRLPMLKDVTLISATAVRIEGPAGEPVQGDGDIIAGLPAYISVSEETVSLLFPSCDLNGIAATTG